MPKQRLSTGFSLLELIVVVAILGVIAALVLPRVTGATTRAKEKTCFHTRGAINSAVERWYLSTGEWPEEDLSDIGNDPLYFPDGIPRCPVSGEAYRLDSTTFRVEGHEDGGGKKGGDPHSP